MPEPAMTLMPPPEVVRKLLVRLDEAGLSPEDHAVLKGLAEQYLEAIALISKHGVTMVEVRSRLLGRG
jgi:hypothetical protein